MHGSRQGKVVCLGPEKRVRTARGGLSRVGGPGRKAGGAAHYCPRSQGFGGGPGGALPGRAAPPPT